jgi:hypothetical protein
VLDLTRSELDALLGIEFSTPSTMLLNASVWSARRAQRLDCGDPQQKVASGDILKNELFSSSKKTETST